MAIPEHIDFPAIESRPLDRARHRSLVRDACRCLSQQMVFWGADARHRDGNLLVTFGLERVARTEAGGEGSSRYHAFWRGGIIELHSFCAGWYPPNSDGVLFIRNRERLHVCPPGETITPGDYALATGAAPDDLLPAVQPLLAWVVTYERWVHRNTSPDYRSQCWLRLLSRMGVRPWLAPEHALEWMERFLADPVSTPRAKEQLRAPSLKPPQFFCRPTSVRAPRIKS